MAGAEYHDCFSVLFFEEFVPLLLPSEGTSVVPHGGKVHRADVVPLREDANSLDFFLPLP